MSITVNKLTSADRLIYNQHVENCDTSLMFHTSGYMDVLAEISPDSELIILAAYEGSQIVGTLPTFLQSNDNGAVLNSLPYFGSHGDFLLADDANDPQVTTKALVDGLKDVCHQRSIGAVNIVSHPLTPGIESLADKAGLAPWDLRIGQISHLPVAPKREKALEEVLASCLQKTRNLVRKGLRQDFTIEVSTADEDWQQMQHHHHLGMKSIGGRPKYAREFAAIRDNLEAKGACRLYVAKHDGAFAGALLNLYHRQWVEYFTPVAVASFRNRQVLSALIATAMCDAIVEGRTLWNWGGTWSTQAGVHHFKRGWGAIDHVYRYIGAVWDARLKEREPKKLLEQFPFFYVRPFSN